MDDAFEFPADDKPEDGSEVFVVARLEDGELAYREGVNSKDKPWRSYPFVIDGGDFDGQWVSLMLTIDPRNFYFRRDVSAITGIDISGGARIDGSILEEKIKTGRFRVTLQTRDKYVNINEVKERFEYEAPDSPTIPVGADAAGVAADDEDIPF